MRRTMILARTPSSWASTSIVALSVSYDARSLGKCVQGGKPGTQRTISRRTSPAVKDSPSFFFHDAIPPSVIVGDIAGMANLESA